MKKLNFFKKLGLCALSAALCASAFAFTACDNDKSGDDEQKQEQASLAVTETEWDAAMKLQFNYSFVETVTAEGQTMTMTCVFKDGVVKQNSGGADFYYQKDGDNYYAYTATNETYSKRTISKQEYEAYTEAFIAPFVGKFEKFAFDGTDTYSCAEITHTVVSDSYTSSLKMTDIKVKFNADKKIASLNCNMSQMAVAEMQYAVSIVFDYSEKTITLPQVAE